jgi:PIN domain nuclease of toxin-antitoxin system
MRILLDTHCWLWLQFKPEEISAAAREVLHDAETSLYFSTASAWEIAIKYRKGKLPLPEPPEEYIPPLLERQRIEPLEMNLKHVLRAGSLPVHHRDPFDRMLAAQAQVEGLRLATRDRSFTAYGIDLLPL